MTTTSFTLPAYLDSSCGPVCRDADCREAVAQNPYTARWFITIGHPGFNSTANNRDGYKSRAAALAAFHKYGGR